MKRLVVITSIFSALMLCLVILCVYNIANEMAQRETAIIGAAGMGESLSELIADTFIDVDPVQLRAGETAYAEAGYFNSGKRLLLLQALRSSACLLIGIFFCAVALVLLLMQICGQADRVCRLQEKQAREWQQERNALLRRLQVLASDTDAYEGNLYHQLKTPLTSLRLLIDQMDKEPASRDSALMQVDHIDRLLHLLLREKQLSGSEIKFSYQPILLNDLLEETVGLLSPYASSAHRPIRMEIPEKEFILFCDETWLRECLTVLLENAVSHSNQAGDILLSIREDASRYILDVSSPGCIPEESLPKLFERWHSESNGHYGIGLHLAKTVAEAHHGSLRARTDQSNGTSHFLLFLPVLQDERAYLS